LRGRVTKTLRHLGAHTLCQLETCLGHWVPADLFPKTAAKTNSRDRDYTRARTFWCMLWQSLHPDSSGREVVRQLQAALLLESGTRISEEDGAYCRAKARLPLNGFAQALTATAAAARRLVPDGATLQGRALKAIDGSAITLPDTPANRKACPPVQCPHQPSFPMLRLVVLFCLASGAITALAQGSLAVSELALFNSLLSQLAKADILLGDRGFGCFPVLARLQAAGIDFIGRTTRHLDGRRRVKRLAKNDWLVRWGRGAQPSPWLTPEQWAELPAELTLRVVKGRVQQKGFRIRQVTLVTTLLDPERYPAAEILQAYWWRWRLELCLDDLKTTLKLDLLRSRSPAMAHRELYARLIAHNLLRCLMAQAANAQQVALDRISFKGSLDTLRHFAQAMACARSRQQRRELWAEFLRILAADLVPARPGRREPRAVKRKKTKYPRLNVPRHRFRDRPKRHTCRKLARLRKLGLVM
jgi:hypothetical protein